MFGKRFNLMTVAGFKIGIDVSWFLIAILLTWTLAAGYFPYQYPHLSVETYWLMGLGGMLGLFISVILHEMGHALVARKYQLPISQITLFIFGGVAEMKQEPKSPFSEFLVAIAGPIVSFIIGLCMYVLTVLGYQFGWHVALTAVTEYLAIVNVVIAIFNLIPAFPLDGGRVFRSILWGWSQNLAWATKIATALGSGFGLALILLGFFSFLTGNFFIGVWWVILGLFLQNAASSSRTQYVVKSSLEDAPVRNFMTKDPICVSPENSIRDFIDHQVYISHHHLYPVTENGQLLGYISLKEVKSIPLEKWANIAVSQIMVPVSKLKTVSPDTNALEALNLIQESEVATLLVVENNHLVGILTAQDLFKIISLKLELEH